MSSWEEALTLFWPAFAASVVVALACALVGVHVLSRRLVVVGAALPQAAALGIALSFVFHGAAILGDHDVMALACEGAAVAALALAPRWSRLGQDAAAGVVFAAAASLSVLVVQSVPQGLEEIRHLVEGNMLAVHRADLPKMALVLGPVLLLHVLGARRLVFCTFDRETAAALGIRTGLWETALFASLALTVAAGVHATGTLFVFGFLVLPAALGVLLGRTAAQVLALAGTAGAASAALGFVLSYAWDTPPGPTSCAVAAALLATGAGAERLLRRA
jgi:iron/zinc/copper transport system permease protein